MKIKDINGGWDDSRSFIETEEFKNHKRVKGLYFYRDAEFTFSLNEQKPKEESQEQEKKDEVFFAFRGKIKVKGADGKILKYPPTSKEGEKIKHKHPGIQDNSQLYDITHFINVKDSNIESIKENISKSVSKLYQDNVIYIEDVKRKMLRKDVITLSRAIYAKFDVYISNVHPDAGPKRIDEIERRLHRIADKLPNKPMKDIIRKDIAAAKDNKGLVRDDYLELDKFWKFCVENRICNGGNPVDVPPEKRKSNKAKQNGTTSIDYLTIDEQDRLYAFIEHEMTAPCIAAALMLGAKATPVQIAALTWDDIAIIDPANGFVIIKRKDDTCAGATHNRSKPLSPQAGFIIVKEHDYLLKTYSESAIRKMPVVWDYGDHRRPMNKTRVVSETKRIMLKANVINLEQMKDIYGNFPKVSGAQTLLHRSYDRNIDINCNLGEDEGTALFMKDYALTGNCTNDNYTSFTDIDDQRRKFEIMGILRKYEVYAPDERQVLINKGDVDELILSPDDTRSTLMGDVMVKMGSDSSLRIKCRHGSRLRFEIVEALSKVTDVH